jgi:hypothetical protein
MLPFKNSHNSKQTFIEELYLDAAKETLFPALMYHGRAAPGNNVSGK